MTTGFPAKSDRAIVLPSIPLNVMAPIAVSGASWSSAPCFGANKIERAESSDPGNVMLPLDGEISTSDFSHGVKMHVLTSSRRIYATSLPFLTFGIPTKRLDRKTRGQSEELKIENLIQVGHGPQKETPEISLISLFQVVNSLAENFDRWS